MKHPYRIARQAHLGDFLDELQTAGLIAWVWSYPGSSGEYTITENGKQPRLYGTREAELLAERYAARAATVWFPVPHPGGRDQLTETQKRMEAARHEIAHASADDE
ncbi:hypothetical protein [Cryobacterium sp. 10I5]|uniref:hypothetical protein n=1 Tax=Cryobacterium sp. 10I5 TaxID=3048581 RepID=UPI002B23510C|nr:hypothetical protein [Cryobacterium sp. 10I5]MEB0266404.1 hypothetical protein [Cryobacterium sp. 10I5]